MCISALYREAIARKGGKPKDHAKENVLKMRRQAEEARVKKEEAAASKKPEPFKLKKFSNVESRVLQSSSRVREDKE